MMDDKQEINVLMFNDELKKRLTKISEEVIDLIEEKTNNESEQACVLKVLMESFEESKECFIPFKGRYSKRLSEEQKK